MTGKHDAVWRGSYVLTRQHWQRIDRMNAHPSIHGKLVVVQAGRSFARASGGSHSKLGVADYRRWNLSNDEAWAVMFVGRNLMGTCHERTTWQGFDPHFHDCTIGDDIYGLMDELAIGQVASYKAGGDGVSGTGGDWQPYRPKQIHNYVFLEDDMDEAERKELFRIGRALDEFRENEWSRDRQEAEKDKKRFSRMVTLMGKEADNLGLMIDKVEDASTKLQLQKAKARILKALKEDPDVTGVDNPDDDQMR